MAQIKRNFLKSKMNKDLDARLIPNGEYREAKNINISKSEGSDVGALENIKGNSSVVATFLSQLQQSIPDYEVLDIIGLYADESTSSLYLFITSWTDNSSNRLESGFKGHNFIVQIIEDKNSYTPKLLVRGRFLNFSKNSPIYNVDVLEGFLYWTDNRNQPRKINVNNAYSNGVVSAEPLHTNSYYFCEDQISVAKFAPYEAIKFLKNTGSNSNPVFEPTWKIENERWLPVSVTAPITSVNTTVITFGNTASSGNTALANPLQDYFKKASSNTYPIVRLRNAKKPNGGTLYLRSVNANSEVTVAASVTDVINNVQADVIESWDVGNYITFQLQNPQYVDNNETETKYLEDKFVRFSYRFKYEDNEFSLMAPFTQPLFISKQFNQFNFDNEVSACINGEISWFRNIISAAELIVQLPDLQYRGVSSDANGLNFLNRYKVKQIEFLLKTSNDNNIYNIETIDLPTPQSVQNFLVPTNQISGVSWPIKFQFAYKYSGNKPFQVLPERDVTRVSDATPVRAFTQEIAANRVMYANYLNSHGAPTNLSYECFVSPKTNNYDSANNPPISADDPTLVKEYYASTLKQGRTYQVGVVLSDRYGRQSNVILANSQADITAGKDNSTVYAPYDGFGLSGGYDNFWGNSLKVIFIDGIPESPSPAVNFYPGLYNESTNPLGWYSYKIVVKQQEQEYYNVYLAGATSGRINFVNNTTPLTYSNVYDTTNISLFGGNINKIPKNTSNISSTDKSFTSDTSLYYRVIQQVFDTDNIHNNRPNTTVEPISVTNIQSFLDFAPWAKTKGGQILDEAGVAIPSIYPNDGAVDPSFYDPFFLADKNPFIATLDISSTGQDGLRIGFQEELQVGGPTAAGTEKIPRFSRFLHVAETNPVISELDIYWETTTSGLISDLNTAVKLGDDIGSIQATSPFLFTFEEQYPYDGNGVYTSNAGNGFGDYLLQSNLKPLTSAGSIINGDVTTMGDSYFQVLAGANSTNDISSFFEIVKVVTGDANNPNEFNIKLKEEVVTDESYFNPNANLDLNQELIFKFNITNNDGTQPATKNFSFGNNFLSNNKPTWEYIRKSSWGVPAQDKNDPTDPAKVISNNNSSVLDPDVVIGLKCIANSPFTPVDDNIINDMLAANGGYISPLAPATYFDPNRNKIWNMSIRKGTRASTSSSILSPESSGIGKGMFVRANGNDKIWANKSEDNSAVKFNDNMVNGGAGTYSTNDSSSGLFTYSNGSYCRNTDNVIPEITKIELALFEKDLSYEDYDKNIPVYPGYNDQGATPIKGYEPFQYFGSTAGLQLATDGRDMYGYSVNNKPFVIVPLAQGSPYLVNESTTSGYTTIPSSRLGVYCLLVDPYHPPFNQFNSASGNQSKFNALGRMASKDLVVYRLTVRLRENWSGGRISDNDQYIYVKLSR